MRNIALILIVIAFCSSCAPKIQYGPALPKDETLFKTPGYLEKEIDNGRYIVQIMGYKSTKEELYISYLHKRSTELCKYGYTYIPNSTLEVFIISGSNNRITSGRSWEIVCKNP